MGKKVDKHWVDALLDNPDLLGPAYRRVLREWNEAQLKQVGDDAAVGGVTGGAFAGMIRQAIARGYG